MTTIKTILVGVDFSKDAELAAEEALAIARQIEGANVILGHVDAFMSAPTYAQAYSSPSLVKKFEEERIRNRKQIEEQLETLRTRFVGQGADVSVAIYDGFATSGLAELAEQTNADLLVVGTHGRTGWRRMFLGSVAERSIRYTNGVVLISRGHSIAKGIRRVLVPTDFSPVLDQCMEFATQVVQSDGEIDIFHSTGDYFMSSVEADGLIDDVHSGLRSEGEAIAKRFAKPEVRVNFVLDHGRASSAIQHHAESIKPDLIVMGSHGRSGLGRLFLGSVAEKVVRHAGCSVAVIHHAA